MKMKSIETAKESLVIIKNSLTYPTDNGKFHEALDNIIEFVESILSKENDGTTIHLIDSYEKMCKLKWQYYYALLEIQTNLNRDERLSLEFRVGLAKNVLSRIDFELIP